MNKIKELEEIKRELLSDKQSDLIFSKICLSASPITPILVSARNGNLDIDSLLLNYLIIGLPLVGLSVLFKKTSDYSAKKLQIIDEEINNEATDELLAGKILVKKAI